MSVFHSLIQGVMITGHPESKTTTNLSSVFRMVLKSFNGISSDQRAFSVIGQCLNIS